MTREEFHKQRLELIKRGYTPNFKDGDKLAPDGRHYLYKVIERRQDKYGDRRAINQLLFYIWHLEPYRDRVPLNSLYSLEPVIGISRNIDERIDLRLCHPQFSIDECEQIAEKFGKWVDENIPQKRYE